MVFPNSLPRARVPDQDRVPRLRWGVADPDIDVVHVSTVHARHLPDALAAIEAGKHVLVEKPLAPSADEGVGSGTPPAPGAWFWWRPTGPTSCRSSTSCGNSWPTAPSATSAR